MARNFSKLNFVDAVKIITPNLYLNQDADVSGSQIKFTDLIINSHLHSINKIAQTLNINNVAGSYTVSDINTPTGFSRYFIKQNGLTDLSLETFIKKILIPLRINFSQYKTEGAFRNFLQYTLLPKIRLNSSSPIDDTSAVFGTTAAETHEYLANNLGWLYFLNTSGPVVSPSALVTESIINTLYKGKSYKINDAIKDYQSYLWLNNNSFSAIDERMIPDMFLKGGGTYTNGSQNLEKMHTFIDVIYSPLYIDREEVTVKNAIESFLGDSEKVLTTTEVAGPLNKFYRAMSYLMRDIDSEVENLELLTSISKCPKEFLPYLANLIGWRLRGSNEASWRNQIQKATSLYKKKGTKQGLIDAMDTVIVNNPIDVSSSITEMYESYVPNLLYYLLKTESSIFDLESYDAEKAASMGIDLYDAADKDKNIRAGVDYLLKRAVQRFPHLFFTRNEPFKVSLLTTGEAYFGPTIEVGDRHYTGTYYTADSKRVAILGDPDFSFNYRGRTFPIPPWEEEKFYKNCIITEDLLKFYRKMLKTFCVSPALAEDFYKYTQSYTLSGANIPDLYIGNSYVFFTSSQQYPPNQKSILDGFRTEDYHNLSLWNGKSSTFDFSVCGGHFSGTFFGGASSLHTIEEIVDSLSIVDEFTPAKAIPRVRFSLSAVEQPSGLDFACPTITWPTLDTPASSTGLSNYEVCGVYDRGTGFALGYDLYLSSFDDSRSTVDHANVPVFRRDQTRFSNHVYNSVVNTSAVVPAASGIPRRAIRRRNFHNTLDDTKWYGRDGRNMPSFYNNTSSLLDFSPLGYMASSLSFAPPTTENLVGVYSYDCRVAGNAGIYHGAPVSSTFSIRGTRGLTFSSCDQFVRRDRIPEEVDLFFGMHEKKKKALANEVVRLNSTLLNGSSTWVNLTDSFANQMVDVGYDKYTSPKLDIREIGTSRREGIHSVYKAYNDYFLGSVTLSSLPENSLNDINIGGPSIISHTYGPIYHNANFSINASAIDLSANIITKNTNHLYNIQLQKLYSQGNNEEYNEGKFKIEVIDSSAHARGPYYGLPEFRCHTILSSISFIDTSTTLSNRNKMGVYFLDTDQQSDFYSDDNYLINNKCILLQHGGTGLPRIQLQMRGIDPQQKNILIPEHDFELSLDYLTGKENSRAIGGGDVGVIIRTKNEATTTGERVFFVWSPRGKWEMVKVSDVVTGETGIQHLVKNFAHTFSKNEETLLESNFDCTQNSAANNSVLSYINKKHMQKASIKFHTRNDRTELPVEYATYYSAGQPEIYNGRSVQLHRAHANLSGKTQNYSIEVFPLPKNNSEKSYVLLDKVGVVDKTLNAAASIPYKGVIPDVNKQKSFTNSQEYFFPDGSLAFDTETFYINGLADISTSYYSLDLFRVMSGGMTRLYEMFSCQYNPYSKAYSTLPVNGQVTGFPTTGNGLIAMYLHRGQSTNGIITEVPNPTNKALDYGLPWGKIPYTGICNSTWTFNPDGFSETDLNEDGSDGIPERIAKKRLILEEYWSSRRGFLSVNQWSPFINTGRRRRIGEEFHGEGGTTGGLGNFYATADGPARGTYWWPPIGKHPINGDTHLEGLTGIGWPLVGLARPGHASYEQALTVDDRVAANPMYPFRTWAPSNPQAKHPLGEYFCYDINSDMPWDADADGTYETFAMGEADNYLMKPGVPMTDPNGSSPVPFFPFGISVGSPIMLDFTTWRTKCNSDLESGDIHNDLGSLDDWTKWTVDYENQQNLKGVTLKEQLLRPLTSTPSAMAVFNLVNTDVEMNVPTPLGFDDQRFQWQHKPSFDQRFLLDGHGITFPPMSVYRDILKQDLLDDTYYTFSCWVSTGRAGFDGDSDNDAARLGRESYATSAILTVSPIGSKTTYSRIILKLPDPVESYPIGKKLATSSLDTGGYLNADSSAGRVVEVEAPFYGDLTMIPGDDAEQKIRWFRVEVTMKYDALETDISEKANIGIRCSIQGYNDFYDDQAPDGDPGNIAALKDERWAARQSYLGNPCRLLTWGYMFNARPDLAIGINDNIANFSRKPATIEGIGGATWDTDFQAAPGRAPAIVYEGNGSVVNPLFEARNYEITASKEVYNLSGALSTYNKSTSALERITVLKDAANNPVFSSKLYETVNLYDNSGFMYDGLAQLTMEGAMLRPPRYPNEPDLLRRLSVSGLTQGTKIIKTVNGTIPITPKELLHTLRYFNKIGKGVGLTHYADPGRILDSIPMQSRVAHDSSAIHCSGGGSRLDYTVNPDNPHIRTKTSVFDNITRIDTLG